MMLLIKGYRFRWLDLLTVFTFLAAGYVFIYAQVDSRFLPYSDEGHLFLKSHLTFLNLMDGPLGGLKYILVGLDWGKPILFPVFAAPFVVFNDISYVTPRTVFLVSVYFATFLFYFFALVKRFGPRFAVLLPLLVLTSSYVFHLHSRFMPGITWHMWFIAFVCFALNASSFSKKSFSVLAGVSLALSILSRPIESVVVFGPLMLVLAVYLYRQRNNEARKAFVGFIGLSCVGIVIAWWADISRHHVFGYAACVLLVLAMVCLDRYYNFKKPGRLADGRRDRVLFFIAPLFIISQLWVSSYGKEIWDWGYTNSFGLAAQVSDQVNITKPLYDISREVLSSYSFFVLAMLVIATAIGFVKYGVPRDKWKRVVGALLVALIAIGPMLYAYSLTGTSDLRRIFVGVVILFVVIFYPFCLIKNKEWKQSKSISVLLLVGVSCQIMAMSSLNGSLGLPDQIVETLSSKLMIPRHYLVRGESKDSQVIEILKSNGANSGNVAIFSLQIFEQKVFYEAESLNFIRLYEAPDLAFFTVWGYATYEPYEDVIKRMDSIGINYVIIDSLKNPISSPDVRKKMRSHTFFVEDVQKRVVANGPDSLPGLSLMQTFEMAGRKHYLFEFHNPYGPAITATSHFKEFSPSGLWFARKPGWHSEPQPTYPQELEVGLRAPMTINTIKVLPQTENIQRMPKRMAVLTKDGSGQWQEIERVEGFCDGKDEVWQELKLSRSIVARSLKLKILDNCGDPGFLAFRGLQFE